MRAIVGSHVDIVLAAPRLARLEATLQVTCLCCKCHLLSAQALLSLPRFTLV